jgi:hypothetical protein
MNIHDQTHWQIARMAKTMAMRCSITLDPNLITPRVKTSIKKQLRGGAITMGWSSQAAKIAEQVVGKFELPVVRHTWRGIQVGHITMDTKHRLREIVEADWTAWMLENPGYSNNRYYNNQHQESISDLTRERSSDFYISFHDPVFAKQAQALMAESMTDADRAKIEQAIAALDSNEPIHITTYQ